MLYLLLPLSRVVVVVVGGEAKNQAINRPNIII